MTDGMTELFDYFEERRRAVTNFIMYTPDLQRVQFVCAPDTDFLALSEFDVSWLDLWHPDTGQFVIFVTRNRMNGSLKGHTL